MKETLRVHQFMPASQSNGPGHRAVLWVQGCSLGCPGCFNPNTHVINAGQVIPVDLLFEQIQQLQGGIEGLTISGGEPLQQRRPLEKLLRRVREETSLSVLVFTGFSWNEVHQMPGIESLLAYIDVLLAGRYNANQRIASGLLGSSNKSIHFLTDRYHQADLETVPEAEVILTENGEVLLSGIDPLHW